jgi:hypothetical protein
MNVFALHMYVCFIAFFCNHKKIQVIKFENMLHFEKSLNKLVFAYTACNGVLSTTLS